MGTSQQLKTHNFFGSSFVTKPENIGLIYMNYKREAIGVIDDFLQRKQKKYRSGLRKLEKLKWFIYM